MKTLTISLSLLIIPLIGSAYESTSKRIAVVVNQDLSAEITDSLNTYFDDLRNEGYEPILKEWSLEENPQPSQLKGYLKSLYENGGLQGAVFIGDLPVAMFEMDEYPNDIIPSIFNFIEADVIHHFFGYTGPFPTDHYYMDLNSDEWKDTNGNGYLDKPIFTEENVSERAIWVSRLTVGRTSLSTFIINGLNLNSEIEQIKSYFKKNHEFRTGTRLYTERNWYYISTEFVDEFRNPAYAGYEWCNKFSNLDKNTDFFLGDLTKDTFIKLLTEGTNEIGIWDFHGTYNRIAVNKQRNKAEEWIYSNELSDLNIQTAFLLPMSCWIGDYTANDYFAGSLLFSENSKVQAVISATTPISTWPRDIFYDSFQEGYNIGESYLKYLSSVSNWDWLLNDECARVILGDGTLKRQRYLIDLNKIKSEENQLRSPELREKVSKEIDRHLVKQKSMAPLIVYGSSKNFVCWLNSNVSANIDELSVPGDPGPLLHTLMQTTNREIKIEALLKRGANPNILNAYGWAPLHQAISNNLPDIVALLIIHGADPNYRNQYGTLPLDMAIRLNRTEVANLLREAGAKSDEDIEKIEL